MNISKINYTYGLTFAGSNNNAQNQNPITGNKLLVSECDSACFLDDEENNDEPQSILDKIIDKFARPLTHIGQPIAKQKDVDKLEQKAKDKGIENPNLSFERSAIRASRNDAKDSKQRIDALDLLLDSKIGGLDSVKDKFNGIAMTLKTEFHDGNSVDDLYSFLDTIESDEFKDVCGNKNIQNHMGELIIKAICDMPKTYEFLEGVKDGNISPDEETINEFLTAVDSETSNQDT